MSTILVIEDDHDFRGVITETLRSRGFGVVEADCGLRGVDLARRDHPDLVLSDLTMENGDGLSVIRHLQQSAETADIPCILMTGQREHMDAREGMNCGADDFLIKPFKDEALLSAIEARLRKQASLRLQSEEQLRRERTLLRTLIDHLPDFIYAKDLAGRKTLANYADFENMGFTSEADALGKSDSEVYPQDIAAKCEADDQTVIQTGHPILNREEIIVDTRGRHRWLLTSKLPLRDNQDRIVGLVGIGRDITERRHAETALRESLKRHHDLIEHISDWYWELDTDYRLRFTNTQIEEILGFVPSQVVGKRIFELMPAIETNRLSRIFEEISSHRQSHVLFESLFLHSKDNSMLLETSMNVIYDATGKELGYRGISRDISERRRFEEKLRILSRAVEQSPASVVITDTKGSIEYVNPKFCALTGYQSDEVFGKNPRILKSGETPAKEYRRLWSAISSGGEWHGEFHNRKKSGELYWESAFVSPIKTEDGTITHYLAIKEDITERKRAADEIARLHDRYERILNSLEEGIVQIDTSGNHTFVNRAASQLLGWDKAELLGKSSHLLWHHTHPDGRTLPPEECQIIATMRDGQIRHVADEVFWRKDGTSFPVEYVSTPIREGGQVSGIAVTFRDISRRIQEETDRRHFENQLHQAQKLESIGHLAAGIAHEINTPTQYVGDNLRFMKDAFANLEKAMVIYYRILDAISHGTETADLVHEARESAQSTDLEYLRDEVPKAVQQGLEGIERVSRIVRAMKEFSHPGSEEQTTTDLNHAIESTLTVSRNEWKYVAEMETRFDSELPLVPCLPGDFNQVILNLVVNAAHAIAEVVGQTGAKGKITVSTCRDGEWIEIRVRDTGSGIPHHLRNRIFDPFFTTKPVGKGTGQGLAIARSVVVDKHQGTIDFESEPGQGTTFIIRLPLAGRSVSVKRSPHVPA